MAQVLLARGSQTLSQDLVYLSLCAFLVTFKIYPICRYLSSCVLKSVAIPIQLFSQDQWKGALGFLATLAKIY